MRALSSSTRKLTSTCCQGDRSSTWLRYYGQSLLIALGPRRIAIVTHAEPRSSTFCADARQSRFR